jgi:hypothetical protein
MEWSLERRGSLLRSHPQVWSQQGHQREGCQDSRGGSYYYNFGDGWGASVSVRKVTAAQARKIERKSVGFCGYEWMIDSIIRDGEILVEPRAA